MTVVARHSMVPSDSWVSVGMVYAVASMRSIRGAFTASGPCKGFAATLYRFRGHSWHSLGVGFLDKETSRHDRNRSPRARALRMAWPIAADHERSRRLRGR